MKTRHFHFSWAATYAFTKFYLFRHWRCNEKIFRNLSGPGFPGCTSRALNDCTSPNNSKIISKEQMSFYGANRKRRLSRSANDVSKFPESSRPPIKFSFVLVVLPPSPPLVFLSRLPSTETSTFTLPRISYWQIDENSAFQLIVS